MAAPVIPFVALSQILAIILLVLTGYWTGSVLGGFAWDGGKYQFNLHPLLMILGLVFFYGDAIMMFRIFRTSNKTVVKVMHFSIQIFAVILAIVGLKAVFMYHNENNIPNLRSAHSWVGFTTFLLFLIQWIAGFISFFYPKLSEERRAAILPIHRFFGIAIFGMACATALMGVNEKLYIEKAYAGPSLDDTARVGNTLCLALVAFALSVGFFVTYASFQREDIPDVEKIPLAQAEMRHFSSIDDDKRVLEE